MAISGIDVLQIVAPLAAESWIASVWQGMALATGVWLSLKMLPKISASTRFVVWTISFFAISVLPFLRFLPVPLHTEQIGVSLQQPVAPHFVLHFDSRWAIGITSIWIVASLFHAVRLVLDLRRLHQVRRTSTVVASEALSADLRMLLHETGRKVELHLSDTLDTPSAIGFLRPMVVLPRWLWEEFSAVQLKQVLLHELAHLRRYDDWTNLFQKFIRALLPLNPALYWIEKHLCFEREMACDDAVLGAEITAREYAACLTTLAGKRLAQRTAVLAPGAVEKQSELSRRVHSLLSRGRNSSLLVARGVAAGFLVAILGGTTALTQCPQWIAFAAPEKLQISTGLQAVKIPEASLEQAALHLPSASPVKAVKEVRKQRDVVPARRALGQTPAPVVQEVAAVTDEAKPNSQVVIVLSVWESSATVQVQRTALILTEDSSTKASPAAQLRQGWFIFQI